MAEAPLYRFTVFTATYNRAHLLHRVYHSLARQTFRDFEWIVVDDGSSDNTREVVAEWQKNADFPIRYIWQENGHKKKAYNTGVAAAQGELFISLDSDDECVPEALERFNFHWMSIPHEKRGQYVGVNCLCKTPTGELFGDKYPKDVYDHYARVVYYLWRMRTEKWLFQRVDILKCYPFNENVKGYVSETTVTFPIGRHYKVRGVNEALRIYHLENQNSAVFPRKDIADGEAYRAQQIVENDWPWIVCDPWSILKAAADLTRFQYHLQATQPGKRWPVKKPIPRLLVALLWPVGYFYYKRDGRQSLLNPNF